MASLGYSFLLVLTAFIWGSGFVAQIEGNAFGPFAFSCIRCFIAAGFLALIFKILDAFGKSPRRPKNPEETKLLWKAGFFCGLALCSAMNLQQLGMYLGTSAGKAGFLTACYIVLVPVVRLILGHRISLKTWICVAITTIGLYLLCIKDGFSIELSDGISLLCALAFYPHLGHRQIREPHRSDPSFKHPVFDYRRTDRALDDYFRLEIPGNGHQYRDSRIRESPRHCRITLRRALF